MAVVVYLYFRVRLLTEQPKPQTERDTMPQPTWAVIRDGKIELLEPLDLPDGTMVIVTTPMETETDAEFWRDASASTLNKIWNNDKDDIYAELLNP
jgi:hypothetical protein